MVNKGPCYPNDRVRVVLCLSLSARPLSLAVNPHLGSRTESGRMSPQQGESMSMCLAHQGCPPFCVRVSRYVCCMCSCILPHPRQLAFVTSCNLLRLSLVTLTLCICYSPRPLSRPQCGCCARTRTRNVFLGEHINHSDFFKHPYLQKTA